VIGALDDAHRRAGNLASFEIGALADAWCVRIAHDYQRRHRHVLQAIGSRWRHRRVRRRCQAKYREVPRGDGLELSGDRRAPARDGPDRVSHPRLEDRLVTVLDGGEDGSRLLGFIGWRRKPVGRRRDQHQAGDAVRMQQREIERGRAAKRMADQVRPLDLEVIEHREQIVRHHVRLVGPRRFAERPDVVADHAKATGKHRELMIPALAIHERAMEKHDSRSRPGGVVREGAAGHCDPPVLHGGSVLGQHRNADQRGNEGGLHDSRIAARTDRTEAVIAVLSCRSRC
jgi:hypothetical protein